jgi:hypothetical protein
MGTLMMRKGGCFCGAVAGEPEAMGYCLCQSCRSCSGGPVNAFTLGRPNAVQVTAVLRADQNTNVGDLCRELGVTRSTLYRHVFPNGEPRSQSGVARVQGKRDRHFSK